MSSLTTWNRIEIETRNESLAEGLAARVHDPLWMLGRQWQMGEFQGTNGGSPLRVDIERSLFAADHLRMGQREALDLPAPGIPPAPPSFDSRAVPLEALVEQDGVGRFGEDLRLRARGGRYFLDLLTRAELTDFQAALLLQLDWAAPDPSNEEAPFVRRVRGRMPDGKQLFTKLSSVDAGAYAGQLGMSGGQPQRFVALCDEWRTWYAQRAGVRDASTWNAERLDYSFELTAPLHPSANAPIAKLQAREYRGGRLDWDAFHAVRPEKPLSGPPQSPPPAASISSAAVPTPVTFPGMPASRFWAMEDARIDLGNLDAGPGDIGRVLLAELVLLWANDWFVAPVAVERTGVLVRLGSVVVTDTFGVKSNLSRAHQAWGDPDFQLFRVSGSSFNDGPVQGLADYLFLPPVTPASLDAPIEELTIVRDEAANLAWAIERIVPGLLGRPRRPSQSALPSLAAPTAGAAPTPSSGVLRYETMTPARQGWLPLAPTLATAPQQGVLLRRAEVVDPRATPLPPQGAILTPDFRVRNEEVPREGLTLRRQYELARAQDGSLHLWISREKRPAAGEISSGLRFDFVTEVPATE